MNLEIKFNEKLLAIAELYEANINGKMYPAMKVTTTKAKRPFFNKYFTSDLNREGIFKNIQSNLISREEEKIKAKESRKIRAEKFKNDLKVGDILTCSWGWEQTNVEFYQVVGFNKNKTKVKLQEMSHKDVDKSHQAHGMACEVMPGEVYGEIQEFCLRSEGIIVNSSVTLQPWSGKPQYKSWYY